jgi:hypothetical protein
MSRKSLIDKSTEKPIAKMVPEEIAKSVNVKDSLSPIREDCPDKPTALIDRLIQKELRLCSERLGLDNEELQVWITLQAGSPAKSILHALRTARQYALDLLQEEVLVTKYEKDWQVSISVDGWIKIINTQLADWVNINDPQSPNWAEISTSQTVSWVTIPSSQTPSWTGIDDDQNPNWQNIPNSQ